MLNLGEVRRLSSVDSSDLLNLWFWGLTCTDGVSSWKLPIVRSVL